jgi:cytochrome c
MRKLIDTYATHIEADPMVRSPRLSLARGASHALALLLWNAPQAFAAGDATKGAAVFSRCAVCHNAQNGGGNRIGPNLFGVVGRAAGTVSGYSYSTAMKGSGLTWTEENLTEYLTNPKTKVPGNKMSFGGLSDATQVADLIAYLKSLK